MIRTNLSKITNEEIFIEAKKYSKRKDFKEKSQSIYNLARRRGILQDCQAHMPNFGRKQLKSYYRKIAKKYKSRTEFYRNSRGAWKSSQKRFGKDFFDSICSHMVRGARDQRELNYKKHEFKPKLIKLLNDNNIKFNLDYEYKIPKRDNLGGVVDFVLTLSDYNLLIPIEIKDELTQHVEGRLKKQIKRYDRAFRERKGFHGTYLLSKNGKYGFSEETFFNILKHLISNEELYTPNNLTSYKRNSWVLPNSINHYE